MGTQKEVLDAKEIHDAAGTKTTYYWSRYFPFLHKEVWSFGGHCGCCGRWNWQWTAQSCDGWSYACKICVKEGNEELKLMPNET